MAWFSKKDKPKPAPAEKPSAPALGAKLELPPLSRALSANERAFLVTCCDGSVPALITWPELGIIRQVTFSMVDGDEIRFRIAADSGVPYKCRPRTQCVVSFFFRDRTAAFIGYEEVLASGNRSDTMVLRMPTQLAVEGRTRFRIPILPKLGLVLEVVHENHRITVPEPIDISVAGVMLAFPKATDPGLPTDQELGLILELEGDSFRVPISVRQRQVRPGDVRYGCLFHNGHNGFTYDQDVELNDLIMGIERYWARNRNR